MRSSDGDLQDRPLQSVECQDAFAQRAVMLSRLIAALGLTTGSPSLMWTHSVALGEMLTLAPYLPDAVSS